MDWLVGIIIAIGKYIALIATWVLTILVFFIIPMCTEKSHLSDQELIENLNRDKARYEQLIEMFRHDKPVTVVHPTWIAPKNAISNERWNEYKRLFKSLKLDAGMRSWGDESIYFISTATGMLDSSSSKGYVYKPQKKPEHLQNSLDDLPKGTKASGFLFRPIDNDWYLVLSR